MAAVEFEGVSKRFGAVAAVDGVSLTIPEGSFAAILGPSGCGKTTLLRLVAGLETASAGRIRIGGADVTRDPPERRRLGMLFQSYALLPHMTVAENVRFPLRMRRVGTPREQAEAAARALALVRLEGFSARYPRQLSGGQQQRVALARAIVGEPRVLLLDEPLSNLDAQLRKEMQVELIELQRKLGLTTIFVTHDQEEALSLADLVVLMHAGRIEQSGSPRAIYEEPGTQFAAAFIGAANLLPAVVRGDGASWHAELGDGIAVAVDPPADARRGERHLALRQEDLRIAAPGALPPGTDVAVTGTLVATVYQGSQSRFVVAIGRHRLSAVGDKALILKPGEPVGIGWRKADARLF
jgi:ABC-type Fe3+/spermidine/putrescine transport system ATPase subunit